MTILFQFSCFNAVTFIQFVTRLLELHSTNIIELCNRQARVLRERRCCAVWCYVRVVFCYANSQQPHWCLETLLIYISVRELKKETEKEVDNTIRSHGRHFCSSLRMPYPWISRFDSTRSNHYLFLAGALVIPKICSVLLYPITVMQTQKDIWRWQTYAFRYMRRGNEQKTTTNWSFVFAGIKDSIQRSVPHICEQSVIMMSLSSYSV